MRRSVLVGGATTVLLVVGGGPAVATPGGHDTAPGTDVPPSVSQIHGDHEAEHGGDTAREPGTETHTHGDDTGHGDTHPGHAPQGDGSGHGDTGGDHDGHVDDEHAAEDGAGHGGGDGAGHGGEADDVSPGTRASVLSGFGAVNAAAVVTAFVLRRRGDARGRRRHTPVRRGTRGTAGRSLR